MTKTKNTKRALIASVLSLLLCVSMLVGSTFAWFTDSATTGVSNIVAGTLDIALYTDEDCTVPAEMLSFKKAAGHESEAVLFEPGAKYELTQVWLKNDGNLHAKYQVVINGVSGNDKLAEVLDVIIDGQNMGTLKNLVANAGIVKEHHIAPGEKQTFGKIELMMQTSANNDYQGKTIDGISITVLATQYTAEYDSKDNQYDADAKYVIDTYAQFTEGDHIIDLSNTDYIVTDNDIADTLAAIKVNDTAKATISGDGAVKVTVDDTTTANAIAVWARNGGQIVIEDGTYIMERVEGNNKDIELIYVSGSGSSIVINGGTFKSDNPRLTLNIHNSSNGTITVMGGTYWEFNPEDAEDAGVIIPEGYKVISEEKEDGTWYTVVYVPPVAEMSGTTYESFDEAYKAASKTAGTKEIKLLNDAVFNASGFSWNGLVDLTIDLQGKTLTLEKTLTVPGSFYGGNSLTIEDSVGGGKVIFLNNSCIEFGNDYVDTLNIEGGIFIKESGSKAIICNSTWTKSVRNIINISGGDFTGVVGGKVTDTATYSYIVNDPNNILG